MIKELLLSLNERTVAFQPIYARKTGSVTCGILLSQLMYWNTTMKGETFFKTDAEIREETALSERELKTAKAHLKTLPFLTIDLRGVPAKTFYTFDLEAMGVWLCTNKLGRNVPTVKAETSQLCRPKRPNSYIEDTETTQRENVQNDVLPAPFEKFWEQFGYKKNKKKAQSAFNRLTKANREKCLAAIPDYLAYIATTNTPQMHPTTWINGERWEDDFTIPDTGKKVVNTDAALKDCDLPANLQNGYAAYISGMIEKFPALWKSECRVLSQMEWSVFQGDHLNPAQRIHITPANAAKVRGDVHRMLNEKPFERQKFSTVYDAIVAAYIHVCNGQNATVI